MYYRYELVVDDEPQDVGFLAGLQHSGIDDDRIEQLLLPFDEDLHIPDLFGKTESWFTEKGNSTFSEQIDDIISAYRETIFDVVMQTKEVLSGTVCYCDEYQVILDLNT